MGHSVRSRARPWRVGASTFLILFVIGVTAPTYADPGDKGKGSENSAAAEHSNAGGNGKCPDKQGGERQQGG